LLMDTPLTPEQATYVKAVKTSGDALLSLIEELLDYSKIEAGKIDLEHRPFALSGMIEDITELLAPRAEAKKIEIAAYVDERLPMHVIGDAARLRQVLLNLAGNAIKFTSTGGVALIVEPGIWPNEISFLVHDTGIGIPPEARERIFREFEQADDKIARSYGGTGLGLSISDRIVKRMGGRITLESQPGAGSTFEVSIPPKNKFLTGQVAMERQSNKPIENLRPQHLLDAFLWPQIRKEEAVLLEEFNDENARYYVLTVLRGGYTKEIFCKIWFDRSDLNIVRMESFGPRGVLLSDVHYSDWQPLADISGAPVAAQPGLFSPPVLSCSTSQPVQPDPVNASQRSGGWSGCTPMPSIALSVRSSTRQRGAAADNPT